MKVFIVFISLFYLIINGYSQDLNSKKIVRCATVDMMNAMRAQGIWTESDEDFERWMVAKQAESGTQRSRNSAPSHGIESPEIIYTIPVVVHIIYQNETDVWNISDQQVISQIQVLNEDFRRLNADTVNTPALFNGVLGYPNIEFCLARRDTLGQNTTGIVRHRFQQQATWSTNAFNSTVKPATRWNPNLYYNIWIANLSGGVLGYAQFPTGSGLQGLSGGTNADTDGIVLLYSSVGRPPHNPFPGQYNLGRTATHEIGHALGLRHIWGDGTNCSATDYCGDTPPSDAANYGCPLTHASCGGLDMVQNYMDYTDDACKNLFTANQVARMWTVLQNSPRRNSLINSIALTNCNSYPIVQNFIIIPNRSSCLGDTTSVTISHPALTGVANASLRMTYNPDSLTYVGFNSLNPAFSGMTISGGNGSVLMDWNTSSNQTIPSGNLVNLRFRVSGNSNLTWDTVQFPCEFSDVNFNVIPRTFVSGSITQNTKKFTWNRSICEGQSFNLGNQSYTSTGTYQGRRFGTGGACDTLITLNLNVIPRQTILPSVTRCSNQPYSFNGLSLTNSGTYLDTLTNSLGCDSILQLNLTVNPAYNQNQSVVICTGTTYSFGGQNLSSSGTYSHTYTTANGCDSLVELNLFVADLANIQSSNGSGGFCPGGSLRIDLANPIPIVTYQWTKDGSIITGANSDWLLVTQGGVYQLIVQVSPTCSVASNPLTISVLNCNRITGDLKYDNNNQTPLAGVPVHLKTLLGNIVASDTTDAMGGYEMTGINNGNYILDANVNYVPGGINSTDALQVTRFFTSLITLSPLRAKAGDVNGNNITQSSDALLINRRITGVISAFSAGNFVNNLPSVSASGNPLMANHRVLSTGDVNGTYNPLPLAPALVLDTVYGNGNVGTAVVRFTTAGSGVFERGVVWSSSPNPTVSSSKSVAGSGGFGFTHSFSSIDPNNIQYARAYARTSAGVYYSNERSFTSIPGLRCPGTPSVIDIDGNLYHTVQIENQCWTQSNLKVSKYRNGDNIPTGLSNSAWSGTTSGAYAIYNNDPVNDGLYGKLYNHYAVTDSRGLCPTGWHVPSDAEWTTLENQLGGPGDAGEALKSTATQPTPGGWLMNTGATNSSGFTALPGGLRADQGDLFNMTYYGYWWSSSVSSGSSAWYRSLYDNYSSVYRLYDYRTVGFSVRCCRD